MSAKELVSFEKFVTANRDRLPARIRVTASADKSIKVGDVLNVKKVTERYEVEYNNPVNHCKMRACVPHNLGGLMTVSHFPPHHVYSSIHEVALDFPPSVMVLEDVYIQDYLIKRGEELNIIRIHKTDSQQSILCHRVLARAPLMVPFKVTGQFQRIENDSVYTVEELKDRMPLSVRRNPNMDENMRELHNQLLPGIPNDSVVFLKVSTNVHVEYWHQPNIFDIRSGHGKKDTILSVEKNLEVTDYVENFGPVQNVTDVLRGSIGMVYVDDYAEFDSRIPTNNAPVVVDGSEFKQGVIMRGTNSLLLVPKDYDNQTLFRVRKKWLVYIK